MTNIKVKHKSEKAGASKEARGNEVKHCEGIPSFFSAANHSASARDTKEPVCEFLFVCAHLNGATGPRLDNEPCPFAVTPSHQGDREARQKARNKKAGSGRERERRKEGRRGGRGIKNGGEEKIGTSREREQEGGKRQKAKRKKASAERGREGGEVGRVLVWKKDGLARKGFGWFSQKTGRMERGRGEQ